MYLEAYVIVTEVYQKDEGSPRYVTATDLETGGALKLRFVNGMESPPVLLPIRLQATIKGRQFGRDVSLEVEEFTAEHEPLKGVPDA